jgi:hypothetical protein
MDKQTRKLAHRLDVDAEDAAKLIAAGITLPRQARKVPVTQLRRIVGRSKADKIKARLNPQE